MLIALIYMTFKLKLVIRAQSRQKVYVRVYILNPAALATSSQALRVFFGRMATLGRETLQSNRLLL